MAFAHQDSLDRGGDLVVSRNHCFLVVIFLLFLGCAQRRTSILYSNCINDIKGPIQIFTYLELATINHKQSDHKWDLI